MARTKQTARRAAPQSDSTTGESGAGKAKRQASWKRVCTSPSGPSGPPLSAKDADIFVAKCTHPSMVSATAHCSGAQLLYVSGTLRLAGSDEVIKEVDAAAILCSIVGTK